MKNGTVKFWNTRKGFGFINEEGGKDYFFVYGGMNSSLRDSVKEGQPVTFDVVSVLDRKEPMASNIAGI